MFVTAVDKKLLVRQYHIQLKRSGTKVPRVELLEMGPSLDLTVRRTRPAPEDLMKEALKQPKLTAKKVGTRTRVYTQGCNGLLGFGNHLNVCTDMVRTLRLSVFTPLCVELGIWDQRVG